MIKFLIEKFRHTPGPLQQPRTLIADLAEEVYDILETHLKKDKDSDDSYSCCSSAVSTPCAGEQTEEAVAPAAETPLPVEEKTTPRPAEKQTTEPDTGESVSSVELLTVDDRLNTAFETPGNQRKQTFKVLAILWDAKSRKMEPMSAKAVSRHGEQIGLSIRHENVRKVIRMKLDQFVNVQTEGVGRGTVYRYQISSAGEEHFTNEYFK